MLRLAVIAGGSLLSSACGSNSGQTALQTAYVKTCSLQAGGWADQGFESKSQCECYNAFMPEMAGAETAEANLAMLESGSEDAVKAFNDANGLAKSRRSEARSTAIDQCLL